VNSAEVRFKELRADFGKTASDYGRHRAGFPDEFFERLRAAGILRAGMRALDLGTGTGTIARGLALRGCEVTGLDRSAPLMEQAAELDRGAGVVVNYVNAAAEETGLPAAEFDLVTAGQCWHWFDRPRAAAEARRVLKPGGMLVIAHYDWIPLPGNMTEATEKLIEKHSPRWKFGGGLGIYPQWPRDMAVAGFGKYRNLLVRHRRDLLARGVARADSRERRSRRQPCGGRSCGFRRRAARDAVRAVARGSDARDASRVRSNRRRTVAGL
jgi:SAM-dependent methyltransferase